MNEAQLHYIWNRPLSQSCFLNEKQVAILQKDLNCYSLGDLLRHFPFRYEDRSKIHRIGDIQPEENQWVQVVAVLEKTSFLGSGKGFRLSASFRDESGSISVVWFKKSEMIAFRNQSIIGLLSLVIFGLLVF